MLKMIRCAILLFSVSLLLVEESVLSQINSDLREDDLVSCGLNTTVNEFPFIVSLQQKINNTWHPFCGGSIYTPNLIITAAHCVYDKNISADNDLRIYYGSTDLNSGGETTLFHWITVHPLYETEEKYFDVAIVTVKTAINIRPNVRVVQLPTVPAPPNASVTVSGWGVLDEDDFIHPLLLKTDLNLIPFAQCENAYKDNEVKVTEQMICATQQGRDACHACQGNSGSPLVLTGTNTLVGIVSWGNGCDNPQFIGVYTDVYRLRDSIKRVKTYFNNPFGAVRNGRRG